jgi:hypothetical protein
METGEATSRNGLRASRLGVLAATIGLVGTILTLCGPSDAAKKDPNIDLGRTHFQIELGEFTLDGDVVVKGDGMVAASGLVTPEAAAKAEKCRFMAKFEPMSEAHKPVGKTEVRRCETDDPEKDHPAFGPVPFDNDQNIAYVKVTGYLDGQVAETKICRLLAKSCEDA